MGKTYISPSGLAKEVQKIYYGDENNLAQEISKVYVGDQNGIARLVFGNDVISPLYLIQNGASVNTDITGGWQGRAATLDMGGTARIPNRINIPYQNYGYAYLLQSSGGTYTGIVETNNDINLKNYNRLIFDGYGSSNYYTLYQKLYIIQRPSTVIKSISVQNPQNRRTTFTLDISNLTSNYDICILLKCHSKASAGVDVYNLWLEV